LVPVPKSAHIAATVAFAIGAPARSVTTPHKTEVSPFGRRSFATRENVIIKKIARTRVQRFIVFDRELEE
jgi:hypothetical protein